MAKFLDLEGLNYFWDKIKTWVQERFASKSELNQKQNTLISGQNIKTINNESVLGSGNINIQGGTDAVNSVNGKTGDVVLSAEDVGALSDSTSIPSKMSDLTNDSGFITGFTETDPTVPNWAKQSNKPTYTASEVGALPANTIIPTVPEISTSISDDAASNDKTASPKAVKDYVDAHSGGGDSITIDDELSASSTNPVQNKVIKEALDEKADINDIPDVSAFITKSVSDLTNYYLKSETYTKAEVAALIGAIQQFHYEIYTTLPASGESNVLYLIGPTGTGKDKYEEYVYANSDFVPIGDTSIDLSGYVTTSALNTALASYATTQDLDDSKVFWAEVDVTPFADIKDAVDAGRTVMLKDEDGYVYVLSGVYDGYMAFVFSSGEEVILSSYNVYEDDSYELLRTGIETTNRKMTVISSGSDNETYPTTRAVYQALQSYTPTSNLAPVATSGDYDDLTNKPTIPTVPVQDVTVGGTSVVSNGTAMIPQEVFWATYGTTTAAEIDTAVAAGKLVMCNYSNHSYRLEDYRDNQPLYFSCFISSQMRYYLNINRTTNVWSGGTITHENAAVNKVSTITGNETSTTKYPNTKAVYDFIKAFADANNLTMP